MADIRPFQAILAAPERIADIATPPYDVMSRAEAAAMAAGRPLSFLRVTRAEITLPDAVDEHDDRVYDRARENYLALKRAAPLRPDTRPAYYVYALKVGDHVQTGVAAAVAVSDYDSGVVRRHENTRRDKEDDRTRHILTVGAQTGPVFLAYRDSPAIARLVADTQCAPALYDFTADDGIRHTLWRVPAPLTAPLQQAFAALPRLYIADGHHRAASASRVCARRRAENPDAAGTEPYASFLAVSFPASHLRILPYNRLVRGLNGQTPDVLLTRLREAADVLPDAPARPSQPGDVSMYLDGRWWGVRFRGGRESLPPLERLDVSLLQARVLGPLLGIADPRTDGRIEFVGGIRGTDELERRVRDGRADVAFSMVPTSLGQLMDIADANQIMPPKSTWFEPKLRDAIVIHEI
ncbi:MAG: hypothetical protein BWZ02_03155 [Lentisphaerae bacterium ADurb.BinA184]|nr:MAG: hypothetical protein BWZ02_03155 [Lentisphaerae bacterium ADurb.BinA184]